MRYLISLGGDFFHLPSSLSKDLQKYDFIWAVDRGLEYLRALALLPNKVIGDMDSVHQKDVEAWRTLGGEVCLYPRSKDYTDGELAFRELSKVLQKGDQVHLLGAFGSERPDHQANVQAMAAKLRICDVDVLLTDGRSWQYLLRPKQSYVWQFLPGENLPSIVSLLPGTAGAEMIFAEGLAYPLAGETLTYAESRGVSNLLCPDCKQIEISYQKGLLDLYFLYTEEKSLAPDEAYFKKVRHPA